MNTPCEKTEFINYIKERVDSIDKKTDLLLEDRNKMKGFIFGVTTVTTSMVTIIFNVIIFIFKK